MALTAALPANLEVTYPSMDNPQILSPGIKITGKKIS